MHKLILTGNSAVDIAMLLIVNKGAAITIGNKTIPPKPRQSSHHKWLVTDTYLAWSAEIRLWNERGRGADDPANRTFIVSVG